MADQLMLQHLNTLLFALLSMGICVLILFAMSVPAFGGYFVFLLTIGVGLAVVVLMALTTIVNNDTASSITSTVGAVSVFACPDYYGYVYSYGAAMNPASSPSPSASTTPSGAQDTAYALTNASGQMQTTTCINSNLLYNPTTDTSTMFTLLNMVPDTPSCAVTPVPTSIPLAPFYMTTDMIICNGVTGILNDGTADSSGIQYIPWTKVRPFCPSANPYPSSN